MSGNPHSLSIDKTLENGVLIIALTGDIDLRTSPELNETLGDVVSSRPRRVVFDLAGVQYIDSSGVGTLVNLKRQVERGGGEVILAGPQTRVRNVLEITHLDKFFTVVASRADAVK